MIERLPLNLFDDNDDPAAAEPVVDRLVVDTERPIADLPDIEESADVFLVNCQWCGISFDNELPACPDCGAKHIRVVRVTAEEPATITCQWCLTEFNAGPTTCPACGARVVVPGQYVPGEDDPYPSLLSQSILSRQAHSRQLLVGMMAGGGIETVIAGLIGLAITVFDE
ncbi:MAG: hypothetical protein R3A46_03235 [Thermomicrobiales bacterium]